MVVEVLNLVLIKAVTKVCQIETAGVLVDITPKEANPRPLPDNFVRPKLVATVVQAPSTVGEVRTIAVKNQNAGLHVK